jgi:hypothetical protein
MEHKKALSASSIKCLETCSWLYWCQYERKIPQRSNEGAMRGTCVHTVFELLLKDKHRAHHDVIMKAGTIDGSPAVRRLVIKNLTQDGILTVKNYEMCDDMILVGLRADFFGVGGHLGQPEFRFDIQNPDPVYRIRGYIDKIIFYPNGKIKIVDYKSSKAKFSGDDLEANIQSMAYSLAGYKLFEANDVDTEFIFLRFPRQPVQAVHITKEQLRGFEHYLAYIYGLINKFTITDATANFASQSKKNSWLCKAGKTWICPYFKPFDYYALKNPDGSIARTSLENNLNALPGQQPVVLHYEGCPAHQRREGF